jgi:hypothetical protein
MKVVWTSFLLHYGILKPQEEREYRALLVLHLILRAYQGTISTWRPFYPPQAAVHRLPYTMAQMLPMYIYFFFNRMLCEEASVATAGSAIFEVGCLTSSSRTISPTCLYMAVAPPIRRGCEL